MISRAIENRIKDKLLKGKAVILLGARQTGKTTLLKKIVQDKSDVLWLNADETDTIALFENTSSSRFRAIFSGKSIVVIDEAQRIRDIGLS